MSVISDHGIAIDSFERTLVKALGAERGREGANLLAEASRHGRRRVELCDWIYCLARSPGTQLAQFMVAAKGSSPDVFISSLEQGLEYDKAPNDAGTPKRLIPATVSEHVKKMLDLAALAAKSSPAGTISEQILLQALLGAGDELLVENLSFWATQEGLERFRSQLENSKDDDLTPYLMFGADGKLDVSRFAPSAKSLCRRCADDAASMRAKTVTTRHLLYSLLSTDSNALVAALVSIGVDPKNDILPTLTRELTRPGRGRIEGFKLTPETVYDTIPGLFEDAYKMARDNAESLLTEYYVIRAVINRNPEELLRLLPSERRHEIDRVREFIESSNPLDAEDAEDDRPLTVYEIEAEIRKTIIGQDQAVDKVMPYIKRLRHGVPKETRPAGVLLFLGPTGAGKTQLAKELAKHVFGGKDKMIFLEMGQFQSKESMSSFVGAPPGYVGYGEGLLTNGLRDMPEAVVLFDEIEKAHTQVFDALLRFADEGIISDPAGPIRDGRRCIIVMTTNAGQNWLRSYLPEHPEIRDKPDDLAVKLFDAAMVELKEKGFRPEFLGRVDHRITFLPFTEDACARIVMSVLNTETQRYLEIKGVEIQTTDEVRQYLGRIAHKRSLDEGARGAPRAVDEFIITPVIDLMCNHEEQLRATGSLKIVVSTRGTGDDTRIVVETTG